MPEYYNPWSHSIELTGPSGERIRIKSNSYKTLDEYYSRYVDRGYLKLVDSNRKIIDNTPAHKPANKISKPEKTFIKNNSIVPTSKGLKKQTLQRKSITPNYNYASRRDKVVGRAINGNAKIVYDEITSSAPFRISNGNVICILSYNRGDSLLRLINSIKRNTDLSRTTVIISDDCSTDQKTIRILDDLRSDTRFTIIKNSKNLGVSGNTNRLLRCAQRFEHVFLLNDDVEILKDGWENFYISNSRKSGIHHFCYRQNGVYGAKSSDVKNAVVNSVSLIRVDQKPHGAFLYISNSALKKCGYFNEQYATYGMEHVDWSMKPCEFGLQPEGFFDIDGSSEYIRIHSEKSSVENKNICLSNNKELFKGRVKRLFCQPSDDTIVPIINYVVPCRDFERKISIKTVINGIIGQSFPEIRIILVEQDMSQKLRKEMFPTIDYLFVSSFDGLFNKSMAFNRGVKLVDRGDLILHDADMLSRVDYTSVVYNLLKNHDAMHVCGRVLYLTVDSTNSINANQKIINPEFERMVGYFEGGSLAVKTSTYWEIGAFNEDYRGYGCFLPGNKVITNRGLISIEDVRKSDKLLTHTGEYQNQIARVRNYNGPVMDIFVPGRLPIKGVTFNHPFLVHDKNGEYIWKEARNLCKGDLIAQTDLLPDLSPTMRFEDVIETDRSKNRSNILSNIDNLSYISGLIYDIRYYNYDGLVYNFEVDKDHSYYVHGLAVHNCEDCDFYARLKSTKSWLCSEQFDLVHLWHSRTPNWNDHHSQNKILEQELSKLTIEERIKLQLNQLRKLGYINENTVNT